MAISSKENEMKKFEVFLSTEINISSMKKYHYDIHDQTIKIIAEIDKRHKLTNYNLHDYYEVCDKLEILCYIVAFCRDDFSIEMEKLADWLCNEFKDMYIDSNMHN